MKITSTFFGQIPYSAGLIQQESARVRIKQNPSEGRLLGFEHPRTITLGIRSDAKQDLLQSPSQLAENGFYLQTVRRGGEATLHNPGQLVIYPIFHLPNLGMGVRDFLCLLQGVSRKTGEHFGLKSSAQGAEPGLYTKVGKWAFFGLRIQQGITSHGLALNVRNRLQDFDQIRSCGVALAAHDKLENYCVNIRIDDVFRYWSETFSKSLGHSSTLTIKSSHGLLPSSSVGI